MRSKKRLPFNLTWLYLGSTRQERERERDTEVPHDLVGMQLGALNLKTRGHFGQTQRTEGQRAIEKEREREETER